jgi:hypothetical protein
MDEHESFDLDDALIVEIAAEQAAPLSQQQIVEIVGAESCMATCSG